MNNFILKDCGGKTYVEECIQCEGREETVDVLYAPSSFKRKGKVVQLSTGSDLHLKHVSRLWHNIWCCEVDLIDSVEELETWRQPGTYEKSRVKTQSRNALHNSLLKANPCHSPRCRNYFESFGSRATEEVEEEGLPVAQRNVQHIL